MNNYLDSYIDYLRNSLGKSDNTCESYERDLRQFTGYFDVPESMKSLADPGRLLRIKARDIEWYLNYLVKTGKSKATIVRMMSSLRGFYRYLMDTGEIDNNPASIVDADSICAQADDNMASNTLRSSTVQRKAVRNTHREFTAPEGDTPKIVRDRAIINLINSTGIKATALVSLTLNDAELMNQFEKDIVREYLAVRPALVGDKDTENLFVNIDGNTLSRQGLWKLLKAYEKKD